MTSEMSQFWNERAEEDAFFFVDNRSGYRQRDLERFWAEGARDLELLLSAVGVSIAPTDAVVEIGCGVGRLTRMLAARGASVRALDVSERMLALAREHNATLSNVEWILGDGQTLRGVETDSADVCVSHVVFQHIPDPEVTLSYVREIGRVLRVGGWGAFQISNHPRPHARRSLAKRVRDAALASIGRFPRGQHDPHWLGSMIELDALAGAAADGSMTVERVAAEGTQFCCVLVRRH